MESNALRANCLSFSELLGQAVALISPTMTAALIIPVMFSNTANMSWLAYLLGTVMLLFVALNLNQFARRSAGVARPTPNIDSVSGSGTELLDSSLMPLKVLNPLMN